MPSAMRKHLHASQGGPGGVRMVWQDKQRGRASNPIEGKVASILLMIACTKVVECNAVPEPCVDAEP